MSVSLDGFYAGPRYDGPLTDLPAMMASAEALGFFRVIRWVTAAEAWRRRMGYEGGEGGADSEIVEESVKDVGAYVMGRRMADGGEVPWGEEPPFHAPVFVVTHRPRQTVHRKGGTSFTYVTDGIESAVEQARAAAGGRKVAVSGGGRLIQQMIRLGLLDELELHIAPVLLGDGMRLLGPGLGLDGRDGIELTPERVVGSGEVTHIRYRIGGRQPLALDDRGQEGSPALTS